MAKVRKNPSTAFWLTICLGGVGAHHFYMGRTTPGLIYLLTFWTGIPVLIALVETFGIKRKVRDLNERLATETAMKIRATAPN